MATYWEDSVKVSFPEACQHSLVLRLFRFQLLFSKSHTSCSTPIKAPPKWISPDRRHIAWRRSSHERPHTPLSSFQSPGILPCRKDEPPCLPVQNPAWLPKELGEIPKAQERSSHCSPGNYNRWHLESPSGSVTRDRRYNVCTQIFPATHLIDALNYDCGKFSWNTYWMDDFSKASDSFSNVRLRGHLMSQPIVSFSMSLSMLELWVQGAWSAFGLWWPPSREVEPYAHERRFWHQVLIPSHWIVARVSFHKRCFSIPRTLGRYFENIAVRPQPINIYA